MANKLIDYLEKNNLPEISGIIKSLFNDLEYDEDVQNKIGDYLVANNTNKKFLLRGETGKLLKLRPEFFNLINQHQLNDGISQMIGLINGKYDFSQELGILGSYNQSEITQIVDQLNTNGYYVYPKKLPEDVCNRILKASENLLYVDKAKKNYVKKLDVTNTTNLTNWIKNQKDIANISEVQELMTDPTILGICQEYLQTVPINCQTNLWWSVAKNNTVHRTQSFHQDYDDVKFVKVFIYLSDVTSTNGPHVYIKNSRKNRILPRPYKPSQRLTEDFARTNYGDDIIEFTAEKGTIIFEDTNGFHKGKPLQDGYRIMLQLQFAASTLWAQNGSPPFKLNFKLDSCKKIVEKYPLTYIKYN